MRALVFISYIHLKSRSSLLENRVNNCLQRKFGRLILRYWWATKSASNVFFIGSPKQGTWKCVGRLTQAHQSEVRSVSYAPVKAGHGRFASCGDTLQIYREVFESTSDHPLFVLEASSTRMNLNAVRWHPRDGSMLATAGDDGRVRIWSYGKMTAPSAAKI